ncbi:MAG: amino acid adenylation domain-containing protein, partial [Alphaproteobacteria bacterium]|nr:amino acid adenylation domain-containing protein [Alphaproteobacteria bacterium]
PFEQLVDVLSIERSTNRNPVFQVRLVVIEQAETPLSLDCLQIDYLPSHIEQSKFDLLFRFFSSPSSPIAFRIEYLKDLYTMKTVESFGHYYKNILQQIVKNSSLKIRDISLTTREEEKDLLGQLQANKTFLQNEQVHQLFEKQAHIKPDAVAVVYDGKQITYKTLNQKANQLAHYLIKQGIKPGNFIAIGMERSLDFVIHILGILKAGCAYVPIDPHLPLRRQEYILSNSGSLLFLTDTNQQKIDNTLSVCNPNISISSRQAAYLIYTSGTTGNPKGVIIEHRSLVNYVSYLEREILDSQVSCFAYVNAVHTDLGHTSLFSSLLCGKRLYIEKASRALDVCLLVKNLDKERANFLKITPSYYEVLADELNHDPDRLNKIQFVLGGESFSKRFLLSNSMITNHYGPTETTVGVSTCKLHSEDEITIGKAISNVQIYILDENLTLLPNGIVGQLYIGGVSLAQGYMSQPDLTAEKFIANPFAVGERIYKTGDLGRYLENGQIEFLGRFDDQIKIRGYRIECKEIEALLRKHGDINSAYVTFKTNTVGEKELVGYIVSGDFTPSITELEEYLKEFLPEYMIPSQFMMLEKMPLTSSGKVDRKSLPDPELTNLDHYVAPRSDLEAQVCAIWQEVLGLERISVQDNFFRLGGNSIQAILLANNINKLLDTSINVASVFRKNTVEKLTAHIVSEKREKVKIHRHNIHYKEQLLSSSQERLWFIEKYEEGSCAYNIPYIFKLSNQVNIDNLVLAIKSVVDRHEILRTVIREEGKYQFVLDEELSISILDINEENLREHFLKDVENVFDLVNKLPIRINIYKTNSGNFISIVIHHIAFDGWSGEIFFRELETYYNYYMEHTQSLDLPELPVQYKDFALWQKHYLTGEKINQELAYWQGQLEGFESLNLLTDKPRPKEINYAGNTITFEIDGITVIQLRDLAKNLKVSLYSLLLSGYYLMLRAFSYQDDIVVGTPVANRHYPQVENLIGFFVNTLVLRVKIDSHVSIKEFIEQISQRVIEAQYHQDLPFERLVEKLKVEKDVSRHPIFQVMFSFEDSRDVYKKEGILELYEKADDLYQVAKFDISTYIQDQDGALKVGINYSTSLFEEETIRKFFKTYFHILKQFAAYKLETKLHDLSYLVEEEKGLLSCWNETRSLY